MKQVKIAYDKCKKKMPNRPPDEIDFGLGWRAALRRLYERIEQMSEPPDCRCFLSVQEIINEELQ